MANKKFSEFELKTNRNDVSHIVGYNGSENVRITSSDFFNGPQSVYVSALGTPAQNGVDLLAGYVEASSKVSINNQVNSLAIQFAFASGGVGEYIIFFPAGQTPTGLVLNTNYTVTYGTTPAQTLVWRIIQLDLGGRPTVLITDTSGNPQAGLTIDTSAVPMLQGSTTTSTLIIGPGEYDIATPLVIDNYVSVVSLTGQKDVIISGGDVQVTAGANIENEIICGLYLKDSKFIVDSGLDLITFKNIKALAENSFDNISVPGGSLSGTFIDCEGGRYSFASSLGANASGAFIGCKGDAYSFGSSSAITSGRFIDCDNSVGNGFGQDSQQAGGYFKNCTGGNSFGGSSDNVNAVFDSCNSGQNSFAWRSTINSGTFRNCHTASSSTDGSGNGSSFGAIPIIGAGGAAPDHSLAFYYNCTALGSRNFGSGSTPPAPSTYIGCVSRGYAFGASNAAGTGDVYGKLFNCYVEQANYPTSGPGKIRNSIDQNFTITTLN